MENDLSRREVIFGAGAVATLGAISSLVGSPAFAQSTKEGVPAFMHK